MWHMAWHHLPFSKFEKNVSVLHHICYSGLALFYIIFTWSRFLFTRSRACLGMMLILLSFYLCHPLLLTHSTSFIRHPFSPSVALIFPSQLLCLFSTFIISFVSSTWSLPQSSFSFLCHSLSINLSLSPYVSLTYFCHPFAHYFPFSPTPSSPFFNIFSSLHSLQPSVFLPFIFLSPIIFLLSPSILSSYLPPFPLPSSVLISLRYPSSLPLLYPPPPFFSFFSSFSSATQPQDKWTDASLVIYSLLPPPPSSTAWGEEEGGGMEPHI